MTIITTVFSPFLDERCLAMPGSVMGSWLGYSFRAVARTLFCRPSPGHRGIDLLSCRRSRSDTGSRYRRLFAFLLRVALQSLMPPCGTQDDEND